MAAATEMHVDVSAHLADDVSSVTQCQPPSCNHVAAGHSENSDRD